MLKYKPGVKRSHKNPPSKPVHTNQGQQLKAHGHLPSDLSLPLGAGKVPDKPWWGGWMVRRNECRPEWPEGPRGLEWIHTALPLVRISNDKVTAINK